MVIHFFIMLYNWYYFSHSLSCFWIVLLDFLRSHLSQENVVLYSCFLLLNYVLRVSRGFLLLLYMFSVFSLDLTVA